MSNVSDGTTEGPQDTAVPPENAEQTLELEGFAEALAGAMPPEMAPEGDPENTEAVDKDESADKPDSPEPSEKSEADDDVDEESTDEAEETSDEADEDESPDETPVNFDGFSDSQKSILEGLLKAGHVDPEFVEEMRAGTLRQADYTKKTMALADKRRDFDAEMEQRKEDLALLDKIRGDDHLHDVWLRMSRGDIPTGDTGGDSDELVDTKTARELVDERLAERERERAERTQKQQAQYEAKQSEMRDMVQNTMRVLGVEPDVMKGYLEAEEQDLPSGVDPITHFSPVELQRRVTMRHEVAKAKAEAEALRKKLSKRTAKEKRAAKQSLPPARRVSGSNESSPLSQTEADLGLDPGWSNVQGFGFRDGR